MENESFFEQYRRRGREREEQRIREELERLSEKEKPRIRGALATIGGLGAASLIILFLAKGAMATISLVRK